MAINFIPEKFYIARQPRGKSDEWVGFMQPMHKDGFTGRKETADRWAGSNALPPIEWENVPTAGYSLTCNTRRYMNKNVVWRVLHPLGFEFEISSDNFSDFLMEIDMKQGIIQTEMIFVRRSGENYLTWVGSPVHKKAVSQASIETKVSLKDLQIGDKFTMKNGQRGQYAGAVHVLTMDNYIGFKDADSRKNAPVPLPDFDAAIKSIRRHMYYSISGNTVTTSLCESSSLSIISIQEKAEKPGSVSDVISVMRDKIKDINNKCTVNYRTVIAVDDKPMQLDKMHIRLEAIPCDNSGNDRILKDECGYSAADGNYLLKLKGSDTLYSYYGYQDYSKNITHRKYERVAYPMLDGSLFYAYKLCMTRKYYGTSYDIDHTVLTASDVEAAYVMVIERP